MSPSYDEPLTVEHLINSLGQIEIWTKAVRRALSSLDPKTELRLSDPVAKLWRGDESPLRTRRECPPPD
jgi:hypothetical protein